MREGKCGTLAWECLTLVVCDSRMLPPQSNSLKGSPSPHWACRCLKILLRQTVAQEDHNATREFGISES